MSPMSLLVPSLADFVEHWFVALNLFALLFAGLAFLFARGRIGSLLLGFLQVIASIVTSPFVYMQRITSRMADFGDKGDTQFRSSRLYLVNKLLIALHAVLIISALSGLAVTALMAWEAFRPAKELRDGEAAIEERLATERKELAPLAARVNLLDEEWKTKRQALVDNFRKERQQRLDAAVRENESIQSAASADAELQSPFLSIRNHLDNNSEPRTVEDIERNHDAVIQFVNRAPISDDARRQLTRYAGNWRTKMTMIMELGRVSEDDLRAQIQTDYRETKQSATALSERVRSDEQDLARIRAAMQYSPGAFLLRVLAGLVGFLFTIWAFGLFIEVFSLAVHLADDVRKLRERAEAQPTEVGPSDHPVVLT